MAWAALLFGWPGALASIVLGVAGLRHGRWRYLLAGLAAGLPFLFYIAAAPRFAWIPVLVAISYAGAAAALSRERIGLAWLLFAPMVVLVAYVAAAVIIVENR